MNLFTENVMAIVGVTTYLLQVKNSYLCQVFKRLIEPYIDRYEHLQQAKTDQMLFDRYTLEKVKVYMPDNVIEFYADVFEHACQGKATLTVEKL
jgi:hypothetical protein